MKKPIMTFPEFESKCQQWFDTYSNRYHLSDLRIWRTVPGNIEDRDVWYCLVGVRRGVTLILLYDHSGELDYPFEVMCDWARKSLTMPSSTRCGYTTHIGEYETITAAFCDMAEEPSPFLISNLNDSYGIGRVLNDEEKQMNMGKMIDFDRLSFLECLDKLQEWRNHPHACEWTGRKMTIFKHDTMAEEIYVTQL